MSLRRKKIINEKNIKLILKLLFFPYEKILYWSSEEIFCFVDSRIIKDKQILKE